MADVPEVADPLYGLPADEFVAARDALVKELRAEGDEELAAQVKALRRPSAAAAALNRAVRAEPGLLDAVLIATAELRDAMGTGDRDALRAATRAEREASRALLAAAAELAGPVSAEAAQRMASTLRAAALDDDLTTLLRRGVLSEDLEATGLELVLGGQPAARSTRTGGEARSRKPPKRGEGAKADGDDAAAEAAAAAERATQREAAEAAVAAAGARAEELAAAAEAAEREAEALAKAAARAEQEATDARAAAVAAAEALAAAKAELESLD